MHAHVHRSNYFVNEDNYIIPNANTVVRSPVNICACSLVAGAERALKIAALQVLGGTAQRGDTDRTPREEDRQHIWQGCLKLMPSLAQALVHRLHAHRQPISSAACAQCDGADTLHAGAAGAGVGGPAAGAPLCPAGARGGGHAGRAPESGAQLWCGILQTLMRGQPARCVMQLRGRTMLTACVSCRPWRGGRHALLGLCWRVGAAHRASTVCMSPCVRAVYQQSCCQHPMAAQIHLLHCTAKQSAVPHQALAVAVQLSMRLTLRTNAAAQRFRFFLRKPVCANESTLQPHPPTHAQHIELQASVTLLALLRCCVATIAPLPCLGTPSISGERAAAFLLLWPLLRSRAVAAPALLRLLLLPWLLLSPFTAAASSRTGRLLITVCKGKL